MFELNYLIILCVEYKLENYLILCVILIATKLKHNKVIIFLNDLIILKNQKKKRNCYILLTFPFCIPIKRNVTTITNESNYL